MGKSPGRIWIGTARQSETGQEEAPYQPGRTAKHHRGNETALEVAESSSEVGGEVNGGDSRNSKHAGGLIKKYRSLLGMTGNTDVEV